MNPYVLRLMMMMRQQQQPMGSTAMDYPYLDDSNQIPGQPGVAPPERTPMLTRDELLSDEVRRDARREGLGALGISLLRGAPTGDIAGSLAEGLAAMHETRNRRLSEEEKRQLAYREEQRQGMAEERAGRESEERILTGQQARSQSGEAFGRQREEWSRADEVRNIAGKTVSEMVANIESVAGKDSPEAREARVRAAFGKDADMEELDKIYDSAVTRSRRQEDFDWSTSAGIGRSQAEIAAGVAPNPAAAERRAERGMDIQEQQLRAYEASIENRGSDKTPSQAQFNDDVKAEADKLFGIKVKAVEAKRPPGKPFRQEVGADGKIKFVPNAPVTEAELIKLRQDAEREAAINVRNRYSGQRVLNFDSRGNLIP